MFTRGPKKMSSNPSSIRSRKWRAANPEKSKKYMQKYMVEWRRKEKAKKTGGGKGKPGRPKKKKP